MMVRFSNWLMAKIGSFYIRRKQTALSKHFLSRNQLAVPDFIQIFYLILLCDFGGTRRASSRGDVQISKRRLSF